MKISDAAKAAAVRAFCSGVDNYDVAVLIFDELGATHGPVDDVLSKYDSARWEIFDDLESEEWWESLELTALDIDGAFDHFEFPPKQI